MSEARVRIVSAFAKSLLDASAPLLVVAFLLGGCRTRVPSLNGDVAEQDPGPVLVLDSTKKALVATIDSLNRIVGPSGSTTEVQAAALSDILGAQQLLATLGYGVLLTGKLDATTIAAIRRFERRHGLPQTGDPHSATFGVATAMVQDSIVQRVEGGMPPYTFHMGPRDSAHAEGVWIRKDGGLWESPNGVWRIRCGGGRCQETGQVPWNTLGLDLFYDILSATREELTAKSEYPCTTRLLTFRRLDRTVMTETANIGNPATCRSSWQDPEPELRLASGYEAQQLAMDRALRFYVLDPALRHRLAELKAKIAQAPK